MYNNTYVLEIKVLQSDLQEAINAQLEALFENIDECVEEMKDTPSDQYEEELANKLMLKNEFTLEVKKSNIPQAQLGVFLRGTYVQPGL